MQHAFWRDASDSGRTTHSAGFLDGPAGAGQKAWFFATGEPAWQVGLETSYEERPAPGQAALRQQVVTWTQDVDGNPYMASSLVTLDPGAAFEKQMKKEQTVDRWGNLREVKIYDYNSLSSPVRRYTYTVSVRATHLFARRIQC